MLNLKARLDAIARKQARIDGCFRAAMDLSFDIDNDMRNCEKRSKGSNPTSEYVSVVQSRVELSKLMCSMRDIIQDIADQKKRLLAPYV